MFSLSSLSSLAPAKLYVDNTCGVLELDTLDKLVKIANRPNGPFAMVREVRVFDLYVFLPEFDIFSALECEPGSP